jgi:hypothetical protein
MNITISKPKVEYHDCECCGSFSVGSFKVYTQQGEFEHFYDGHFGNGDWNGEDDGMYLLTIKDMFNSHYIHLETDCFSNTYGILDETSNIEKSNHTINISVQESKRKVTLEFYNSTYFFPPSIWFDVIEYYSDEEYINYDVLFKNVFDQLNLSTICHM